MLRQQASILQKATHHGEQQGKTTTSQAAKSFAIANKVTPEQSDKSNNVRQNQRIRHRELTKKGTLQSSSVNASKSGPVAENANEDWKEIC